MSLHFVAMSVIMFLYQDMGLRPAQSMIIISLEIDAVILLNFQEIKLFYPCVTQVRTLRGVRYAYWTESPAF